MDDFPYILAGEEGAVITTGNNSRSRPKVEFKGVLSPDLTRFAYLGDNNREVLLEAGFREGDYGILKFVRDQSSAEIPVRLLRSSKDQMYINVIVAMPEIHIPHHLPPASDVELLEPAAQWRNYESELSGIWTAHSRARG